MLHLAGCTTVGPDFETPEPEVSPAWQQTAFPGGAEAQAAWWQTFSDPVLDALVEAAYRENYSLEIAGLRVLEARAQLGIAVGNQFPQLQQGRGGATYIAASKNTANTAGGDLRFWEYDVGADLSWEIDFWGRFRRGIESADANLLASVAAYDDAIVLLTAQVASTYIVLREAEEQPAQGDAHGDQRHGVHAQEVRSQQQQAQCGGEMQ